MENWMTTKLDPDRYGPWAIVTGGSEGTGAEFARAVAAAGINLLLIARRPGPLEALAAELRTARGVEVRTLALDMNAPDAVARIIAASEGLEVGLYISNAGADSGGGPFLDNSLEQIHGLIARNVTAVADAVHQFGNAMRARGRGGIVLMSSGAGLGGQPGVAAYSGVKGFALNLAEALWSELRHVGVDVIGIAAPVMETPALRRLLGDMAIPDIVDAGEVARDALARLQAGEPCRVHAFGQGPEESDRQSDARRDRILWVEKISASLFGGE